MANFVKVRIWGSAAGIDIGGRNYSPFNIVDPIPFSGEETTHSFLASGFLEFKYKEGSLNTDAMENALNNGASIKKNNMLGIPIGGAFSWAARLLKIGGARQKYGVRSPKTLISYTANDLAKYCEQLAVAIKSVNSLSKDFVLVGTDDDDH